jgi:hypothetical protein
MIKYGQLRYGQYMDNYINILYYTKLYLTEGKTKKNKHRDINIETYIQHQIKI